MSRIVLAAALAVCSLCLLAAPPSAAPYVWKNVQIVGGGFVDGIVFHPTAKGVRYARTDMGGAYRWNDDTRRWEPMLDWVPYADLNLMGVESIAVDPSDPNRVYLSCGTYTNDKTPNGAVLRSSDRGRTFQRANVPFKMGGNENGRGNGERMAVDPNDGNIVYLGTRQAGLWRSVDRGATWNRIESFPDVTEAGPPPKPQEWWKRPNGVVFVIFDPRSGSPGKGSSVIYAGASLMQTDNLFRSTDAGRTWQAVAGEPVQYRPLRAVLASGGVLYIAYGTDPGPWRMTNGGLWKLDTKTGAWTDITPDKPTAARPFGYAAVSVDAHNPRALIVSSFYRPGGEEIFRSTNGGETWKPVFAGGGTYDFSLAPYVARTPIHWLFDIEIDPADPDHAIFTTGYGGYETFDLTDVDSGKPTKWSVMSTGIEETVALDLLSPPQGAHLLTAIGDYGGFVHWDLDKPAPEGNYDRPRFNNTNSLACAGNKPEIMVRVGRVGNGQIRPQHRVLARWRQVMAAHSLGSGKEQHVGPHRGFFRRRHLGLDAGAQRGQLHTGSRRNLDHVPGHPSRNARHRRPRQSPEILCNRVVRRKAVYQLRRRGDFYRTAPALARWLASARRQPRRRSRRPGSHLRCAGQ